jgi:hypothetical protein
MDTLILIEPGSSSSLEISPDAPPNAVEAALIAGYALRDAGAESAAEARACLQTRNQLIFSFSNTVKERP